MPEKDFLIVLNGNSEAYSEEEYNSPDMQNWLSSTEGAQSYERTKYNPQEAHQDGDYYAITTPKGESEMYSREELDSPEMQEWIKAHADHAVSRIRPTGAWGDKVRKELSHAAAIDSLAGRDEYPHGEEWDKVEKMKEERAALRRELEGIEGSAPSDPRAIQGKSLNEAQKNAQVSQKRKGELQQQIAELDKRINNNNLVLSDRQRMLGATRRAEKELEDVYAPIAEKKREEGRMASTFGGTSIAAGGAPVYYGQDYDDRIYSAAKRLNEDTVRLYEAPSKYGPENGFANFFQGAKDRVSDIDFWSMGLTGIQDQMELKGVFDKIREKIGGIGEVTQENIDEALTPLEKQLLSSFFRNADAQASRAEDLSSAYVAGQSAIDSLEFMAEFALSGAVTGALGKALSKSGPVKAMRSWIAKNLGKAGSTAVGSAAKRVMSDVAKSAASMFFQPGTLKSVVEAKNQLDESGEIVDQTKAFWNGLLDRGIEVFSERTGDYLGNVLGWGVGKLGGNQLLNKMAKTEFGQWGRAFYDSKALGFLKAGGWHDGVGEILEEYIGDGLRTITGVDPDAWNRATTWDNLGTLAMSFLPMTIIGGGVNTAKYGLARKQYGESRVELQDRLNDLGFTREQIDYALDLGRMDSPENLGKSIGSLMTELDKRGAPEEDKIAAVNYAINAAKMNIYNSFEAERVNEQRNNELKGLIKQYGDFWIGNDETGRTVQRATLEDGRSGFVTSEDENGKKLVKLDDGGIGYAETAEEAIPLNEYLDAKILSEQKLEDEQRMQQEAQSARQQLQANINNNLPIELGTEEAPINGELLRDKDGAPIMNAGLYQAVATDGSMHLLSEEALATKWGIKLQPETQEQKEADEVAQMEAAKKREKVYNSIPVGTTIMANLEEEDEPVPYKFSKAVYDDETHGVKIFVEDIGSGKEVDLPESAFPELEDVAVDLSSKVGETTVAESVDDGVLRDSKGNPFPMKDGKVDGNKLWDQDPITWAAWNDKQNNDGGADTIEYATAAAAKLESDIQELQAAKATELDQEKRKEIKDKIAQKTERLKVVRGVIAGYNDVAAIEQAIAEGEAAPAEAQAAPAVEQQAEPTPEEIEAQRQQPLIARAEEWSKRTGVPVTTIRSFEEIPESEKLAQMSIKMTRTAKKRISGWYSLDSGKVMLYLPNIVDEDEIGKTFLHEVIAHKGLRELLGQERFDQLMQRTWDEIMTDEDKRYYRAYAKFSVPNASDEKLELIAADEYIAHLAENIDTNPTAWDKFVSFVKEIIEKLFDGAEKITKDDLSKLLQASLARYEATAERVAKRAVVQMRMSPAARLSNDGVAANEDEARFSVKYAPKNEEEAAKMADDISKQIGVSEGEARAVVQSETSLASIIGQKEYAPYLDYTADDRFNAIKENSDYPQGTVDFNNICRKRIAFTEMYQRIQQAFPNVIITGEDLANIRNIMKSHGLEVACGLCFVEDRRQLLGEIAKDFIDNLAGNFEDYASRGGATKVKNAEKFRELIGEDKKDDLSIYDLITLEGSTKLYAEHPGIYNAFQAFNNARGQQTGNLFQGYAEYKREILKWSKAKVKSVNDNGGLRIFSYSDFEAHHLIDLVQIVIDCARKGVKIQGYTKVPAFARAVAKTGIKLNRSLIPLGDTGIVDGKLAYDTIEGIDINDENFLESNANVGNILVGINDQQIRMAMADPFVHYIIPYHSNQKGALRNLRQVGKWTNYKPYQNEKDADGKATHVNIYTDVINAAEAEGNPIKTERQFTEKFLEVCKKKGLIPRFEQFLDRVGGEYVYTPGYYKLLLDFKMFDEQGNYLPQMPVVPEFDDAFNAQILSDYVAGEQVKYDENLDEVYNEIVDKLGLNERQPDIVAQKKGEKALANILSALEKKGEARAEEQAPAAEAAPSFEDELLTDGHSYGNKALLEKYGLEAADLTRRGDVVTLNRLVAKERKQGAGTRFMQDLAAMADRNGWSLALTPTTAFGASSVGRLNKFYKRFGFKDNKGTNTDFSISESMIRRPANETMNQVRLRISNADERVFISNAEAALGKIKMERATPEQWLKMLEKEGGLKAAEDKWLGLSDWLKLQSDRKSIGKEEIAEYIAKNQIIIEEQKYAEDVEKSDEVALQSYQDEFDSIYNGLVDESEELAIPREPYLMAQDAFNEMVERYGDDFSMAFEFQQNGDGFILEPQYDWNDEPTDATRHFLDQRRENSDVRRINSTRKGYTTEGLRNLQEIALTVPTIDPWNEGDLIHFGDAGEGRAIAWVRFGDSWTSEAKDEAEKAYREAQKKFQDYRDEIVAKYALQATGTKTTRDLATDEENKKVKELHLEEQRLYHEWQYGSHKREKVLVIDEIQSKRHQEAREQGGYKDDTLLKQAEANRDAAKKAYDDYHNALLDKYGDFNEMLDKITPEENEESNRLYQEFRRYENAVARYGFDPQADEVYRDLMAKMQEFENNPERKRIIQQWNDALKDVRAVEEEERDTLKWALMSREEQALKAKEANAARNRLQAARDALKPYQEQYRQLQQMLYERERELIRAYNEQHRSKIPAAPFEKNWHELALKRMLRYAAEMGYDSIAWTTGEQQADRYNLANVIHGIRVYHNADGTYDIQTESQDGTEQQSFDNVPKEKLQDYIGKELAVRVENGENLGHDNYRNKDANVFRGLDLKVGGEGMKGFYDDILPRFMNKYGKKWNAKVEDVFLPALGEGDNGLTMHSVKVTPEMRESVMQGQLMFRMAEYEDYKETVDSVDPQALRVFHGSGADFERFDHHHMGEGEGNQAYGWGTYVASNKDVANDYAVRFGEPGNRHLYTVEIPADNGQNYIHWDKPITRKQSNDIMDAVRKLADKDAWGDEFEYELKSTLGYGTFGRYVEGGLDYFLGNEINYATEENPGAERNAKLLSSLGIVGIEIPMERGGVRPGSDYVIFNEDDLHIVDNLRFRITPEQDKEYLDAVEAGDMEKAQQMVHDAAALAMPDTKVVDEDGKPLVMYHGTRYGGFNKFDINSDRYPRGAYFTRNEKSAREYANYDDPEYDESELNRQVYSVFLNVRNPLVVDSNGGAKVGDYNIHIREINDMQNHARAIVDAGYDGVVAESGFDEMTVVFNPSQVKSAEPVERDDNGKVIPLSQRFNPQSSDIRFRMAPADEADAEESTIRFRIAYHGSPADFSEFEEGHYREGVGSFHRPGYYFASDEKSVKTYAYDRGNGAFLYEVELPDDDGSNYIHVFTSIPKSKRRELAEKIRETFPEKDIDVERKIVNKNILGEDLLGMFTNDELQQLGFVGIEGPMYIATMPQKQYVIFNPNDIKIQKKTNVSTGESIRFRMVEDPAKIEEEESAIRFRLREGEAPKKTQKVYKLMRRGENKDEVYPLYIDSSEPLKIGNWYDAESPEMKDLEKLDTGYAYKIDSNGNVVDKKEVNRTEKGSITKLPSADEVNAATVEGARWITVTENKKGEKSYHNVGINGSGSTSTYAMRPGWHAGSLPTMRQIGKGKNKDIRDDSYVWVEGEVPADVDYQAEAEGNPNKDIPTHIPTDGYYLKATNADKVKSQADRVGWYVAGAFKPNRIIGDDEARSIIDQWNKEHPDAKVEYDYEREGGRVFNAETGELEEPVDTGEVDGIRFSLRGLGGAQNAEDQVALDNLDIAGEMEQAGKDPKAIWQATGWQRGTDGNWRNEIPDAKVKDDIDYKHGVYRAGDILDAPELFASYPEIADYKVVIRPLKGGSGLFDAKTKSVFLDAKENTSHDFLSKKDYITEEGVRTLLHELQHAIQHVEGFAKGFSNRAGEMDYYKDAMDSVPEMAYFAWFFSRLNTKRRLLDAGRTGLLNTIRQGDKSKMTERDQEQLAKVENYLENISDSEFADLVKEAAKFAKKAQENGESVYHRSAGEVEARNVETRTRLNEYGRSQLSPMETEDTKRENQVVRYRITPEQDAEYMEAVESGDMEKAQEMVNTAAEAAMPNSKVRGDDGKLLVVYHGTQSGDKTQDFNSFSDEKIQTGRTFGDGYYFTDSRELADKYAERVTRRVENGVDENLSPRVIPAFLNIENIIDVEAGLDLLKRIAEGHRKIWNETGRMEDGVVVRNIRDGYDIPADTYVVRKNKNIKSAEPVTYDADGNVIPLSQRFNAESDDIRFRVSEDMQAASDLVQQYEEQDGGEFPWMTERELMDKFQESIPYGADTEDLYAMVDKYNRLDEADFEEGRRDFSGSEKDEVFNEFLEALREFAKGDAETRYRAQEVGRSGKELVKRVQDYGLAGVMDKDSVNAFWSFVLYSLPEDTRMEIIDKALGDDLNIRRQTRAYMADLAAKGYANDESGLLFKAADQLSALIPEHQPLSYDELLYMMWRGSRRYSSNDMLAMATDITMRRRLHVGEFTGDKFPADAKTAVEQTKAEIDEAGAERTAERSKALWKTADNPYGAIVNAMTAQKNYDQKTIDALVALAKEMMRKGDIDKVTSREMARLLTIIKAANGRRTQTMKNSADQLLDFMVDHSIATEKGLLEKVMKLKTAKVKEPGVDIITKLDIRAQGIINAFKSGMKSSVDEIQNRLAEVQNQIDSDRTSETRKEELQAEQEGLTLALRHATDIAGSEAEAKGIREAINDSEETFKGLAPEERKKMEKAHREGIAAAYDMIRQNKIARVEAYRNLRADLAAAIDEGVERAKSYIESERERVEHIHHMANSDLQGVEYTIGKKDEKKGFQKIIHGAFEFIMSPLANTEQLFRVLGRKSPSGEGYLYNYFVRGIQRAWDEEKKGIDAAYDKLNAKVRELFGDQTPTWHDLFIKVERMPAGTMRWFDASGKWVENPVTTGNLLYIYMVNKMADGRMKLRQMGISEEDMKDIVATIEDKRLIDLADWIQEDFLSGLRDKYNAVHNRMFGTSMAAIENYFPLRISKGAVHQEVELGKMNASELASTLTGAIIKRTVNTKQLDLLNADMFTVLSDHIDEMEEWSAFAEIRRDMNTLLSYDRFRNKVESLNTVFGKGEDLWRNMADTFGLAIKMYKPKRPHGDAGILNAAKGVSAAKVNFRIYTALKQMLSFPAFLADARVDLLVKSLATPWMSWKWAMENLPSFKRRWETGTIGNEKLDPDEADSKIWNTKIGRFIMKDGMLPNRMVDAMTIAIGAKAMYDSKYNQYVKEGFDEAVADEKAKTDAELLFNATQQSSEGLFLSTIQKDRTLLSNIVSVFRNSSMGYGRQVLKAFRSAQRVITGGKAYKDESLEYMTKQLVREGLSEEEAAKAARKRFNKTLRDSVVRYAVFGFMLEFLWNLGSHAVYLLFGDDPDEKEKMLKEDFKRAELGGLVEGLAGGQAISEVLYDIRIGEKMYGKNYLQLPLAQDAKSFISELTSDWVRAVNDLVNLAFQIGIGANPQTITDAIIAIVDACNGNFETAEEAMLCILRIIQVPQSQLDQLMIDEIGMSARDARELTYEEIAERYAYYKIHREAPLTSWAYSDETMEKKVKNKKSTFKKKVKERNNE